MPDQSKISHSITVDLSKSLTDQSKCPTVRAFAAHIAHLAAAKFAELGLEPPAATEEVRGVAVLEHVGVRILVSITLFEGTNRLYLTPAGEALLGIPSAPSTPPAPTTLKEIERCIMEAAPRADAEPKSVKQVARIAGYCYNSYFREHVSALIEAKLIVRVKGGIRRAA